MDTKLNTMALALLITLLCFFLLLLKVELDKKCQLSRVFPSFGSKNSHSQSGIVVALQKKNPTKTKLKQKPVTAVHKPSDSRPQAII